MRNKCQMNLPLVRAPNGIDGSQARLLPVVQTGQVRSKEEAAEGQLWDLCCCRCDGSKSSVHRPHGLNHQPGQMMVRASMDCGKATRDKCTAAKVPLTFTAPSPNREPVVPSQRASARLLGIAPSLLDCVDNQMIQKRQQLTAGESGIYWAIAKGKKGY
jgi:hypothetical protein